MEKDEYIEKVIKLGDEGSELLAKLCAPTLRNSQYVEILEEGMNGIAVLRLPTDYMCVVHSIGGDPEQEDLADYARSLVDRLVGQADILGATPIGFANVIDSSTGDKSMLETIAHSLVQAANENNLAILNGENAILGSRVNCAANMSGTMISIIEKSSPLIQDEVAGNPHLADGFINIKKGIYFATFDHGGLAVYTNSDGIGTKPEFYERAGGHIVSLEDSIAMRWDDANKIGAVIKVDSEVIETRGPVNFSAMSLRAEDLGKKYGVLCIRQHEPIGNRLRGYNLHVPAFNLSGSVVSTIDEERLKNPLRPSNQECLVAIRGKLNPRSNGISDKRRIMVDVLGENWHQTEAGGLFLEYLATPSTILYPVFRELIDQGLATSVYHMSGGAYEGKLARPLAKHGLHVEINGDALYKPDWRELAIGGFSFTKPEEAYAKWPMGNDGFITTNNPETSITLIKNCGLQARVVGELEKADGKTGVLLKGIKDSQGKDIYYSGR